MFSNTPEQLIAMVDVVTVGALAAVFRAPKAMLVGVKVQVCADAFSTKPNVEKPIAVAAINLKDMAPVPLAPAALCGGDR